MNKEIKKESQKSVQLREIVPFAPTAVQQSDFLGTACEVTCLSVISKAEIDKYIY